MNNEDVKRVLNSVGIGATLLGIGLVVYGGVMMYKSYLQTELLKLQVTELQNRLKNPQVNNVPAQTIPIT